MSLHLDDEVRDYFLFMALWEGGGSSLYPASSISLVMPFVLSLYNLRISKHMYFQLLLKETLYCFFCLSSLVVVFLEAQIRCMFFFLNAQ